jgi:hypothetical protein
MLQSTKSTNEYEACANHKDKKVRTLNNILIYNNSEI